MNKEDTFIYFNGFKDQEELDELLEDYLFEAKQYFVSKPLLKKLFDAKILKLKKINEAYLILKINNNIEEEKVFDFDFILDDSLKSLFENYHKQKSIFKKLVFQSDSINELISVVEAFFKYQSSFTNVWSEVQKTESNDILLSNIVDEMQIINDIQTLNKMGVDSIDGLKNLISNNSKIDEIKTLVMEVKRLSLQHEKEKS